MQYATYFAGQVAVKICIKRSVPAVAVPIVEEPSKVPPLPILANLLNLALLQLKVPRPLRIPFQAFPLPTRRDNHHPLIQHPSQQYN